ncbi:NADPH-dependent aldehyde reductase Ahr [Woodsholea maritima]|uniref:NADPH-dependent aldehyde reductase Ahr n=1 Tax=Woodsholea maritima TaxID=240237 RepID=UPI00039D354D|nr:NAD(P)-dependent alcohol dehydrogenase [Woodsholea maritima]
MFHAYAAFESQGQFQPYSYDPGEIGAEEVEIKVESCGLCHSDLSLLDGEWGRVQFPFVPGHEVIGTIVETGDRVSHLKPGQKVGVGWYAHSCGHCHPCISGDHNLCGDRQGIIMGRHGGFADRVRVKSLWAVPLPEGIDTQSAGPLFCGGATVFTPFMACDIKPTDRVGVVGIGGLGHMALMFARAWGCEVTAFTSSADKGEEAMAFGAHRVVNSRDEAAIKAEKGRFDLILSTVNVSLNWPLYMETLRAKGRLHCVGVPLEPIPAHAGQLIDQQRAISGSPVSSPSVLATMLEFCARHQIRPKVEVMKMSEINAAFERLRQGKAHYRIVLENDV